ncbi:ROK family transcriptional regulator [Tessaracoccus caeni]|uniref:ROK family transcriptional regulator n=1 Tax=Tessaracoccus caeni TaxID=3031239 RepID=UPI0023D9BF12|nr:ROK family transcriptional regulator [Tessaracoccus caeni]MDF1487834.1 ROK family transcriptional regulator [Tessaracoccus caeni]
MTRKKPGVPSLLRELNDSAALKHIMRVGSATRAELSEHTGLSRVTCSQVIARLEGLGLVRSEGTRPGSRGPAAELYALAPGVGTAVGLAVQPDSVRAELCSLDGRVLASSEVPGGHAVDDFASAVEKVLAETDGTDGPLLSAVVATPGVVDPLTGELAFSYDLPDMAQLRGQIEERIGVPVALGNDMHLAALAELRQGVAEGRYVDFVLLWIGHGLGMASVIDGGVRVGSTGAAGEVGYLPVPGVPLRSVAENRDKGSFQRLVGMAAVEELAADYGVELSRAPESPEFLAELGRRISLGVAAIATIQDPALVVLTGETVELIGQPLAEIVAEETPKIAPVQLHIELSKLGVEGPLLGARLSAVDRGRELVLARIR